MSIKELSRELEGGIKPVYVVLGDAGLLVKEAEEQLAAAALSGGGASFNRDVFRAGEEGAAQAFSVARTLPMLAARRLVLLREVHAAPPQLLAQMMEYCDSPNPSTALVVTGEKWPPPSEGKDLGRRLEGLIKKIGFVLRLKTEDQDPVAFSLKVVSELGCRMERPQAALLVERVGNDLGRLKSELSKAAMWLGGEGEITAEILENVSSLLAEAEVWSLTDALITGQEDAALQTVYRLLEGGEAPHKLLAMVTWQLRQMLRLQDAQRSGRSPQDAGVKMRYDKLRSAQQSLKERPMDAPAVLALLVSANQGMNSHRAGDRRIFEGLILSLLAMRRPRRPAAVGPPIGRPR